ALFPCTTRFRSGAEAGVGGVAHGVAGGRARRKVAVGGAAGSTDGRDRRGRAGRVWPARKREGEDALTAGGVLGHHDRAVGVVGEAAGERATCWYDGDTCRKPARC